MMSQCSSPLGLSSPFVVRMGNTGVARAGGGLRQTPLQDERRSGYDGGYREHDPIWWTGS